MTTAREPSSVVEVRPEVVFLYELLEELTTGRLRIPRFQRPFVWRRDQMTDLLDSVYKQYPIGSILVWETDLGIATLDHLGPFAFSGLAADSSKTVGYVLDGHQRLSTLAGALIARESRPLVTSDEDPGRWDLSWNMENQRFQHGLADSDPATLFPMTALLDTLRFFAATDRARQAVTGRKAAIAHALVAQVSEVARAFQYYRVPVIRMRQTELSEAVEIFARLNSKGLPMTADQMVSALMYRQGEGSAFDLASEIDGLADELALSGFAEVDRTTILRAILANMGEDIYRTDWTRLAKGRRTELLAKLQDGVARTTESLSRAIEFLDQEGVKVGRLLPYALQLVVLSAFFDVQASPREEQLAFLRRWFWVSTFSGWFGVANPSRVNSLVTEIRKVAASSAAPTRLQNFDLEAQALPFPATFDMRSARTRALLLVMLSLSPRTADGRVIDQPWQDLSSKGPSAVGHIFGEPPSEYAGNPANRMIRPPAAPRGTLSAWLRSIPGQARDVFESYGIDRRAQRALEERDIPRFILTRQAYLIDREHEFQSRVGVALSDSTTGTSPIDTE